LSSYKFRILFYLLVLNGCTSSIKSFLDPSFLPGIVQSRHGTIDQYPFTHKYLNASLKALPIIITSGTFKSNGETFSEIHFRLYSKVKTINYKYIELYNSKGEKWEWQVYPKHKTIEKAKHFFVESYKIRIDSQVSQLLKFFDDDAIYLKFIGEVNNFKKLDKKHRLSLIQVLKFAENMANQ
tara:strand:- start:191 stop:736 length:546 start_codon:yes stop_codon:yes gene_type:complete